MKKNKKITEGEFVLLLVIFCAVVGLYANYGTSLKGEDESFEEAWKALSDFGK